MGLNEVDGNSALDQAALVARQSKRWNDPKTQHDAQARIALASVRAKRIEGRARSQIAQLNKARGIGHKIFWLRELAETFGDAVAPHAACTSGCAGCCYQPLALTQQEAQMIAKETGARMHTPAAWSTEPVQRYIGQPCSFLQDARCTTYRSRPMACRLMFNMNADALQMADLREFFPQRLAQVGTNRV